MLLRYCRACREENPSEAVFCYRCGEFLASPDDESYVEKLIWALDHQEKQTPLRAVHILGELGPGAAAAVPALIRAFKETRDVYLQASVIRCLGKIKAKRGLIFVIANVLHPSFLVRLEVITYKH